MAAPRTLSSADRDFFALVARATFGNPFGNERYEIDLQISGLAEPRERSELFDATVEAIDARIGELDADGHATVDDFPTEDRPALGFSLLAQVFHRHAGSIDALIARQIESGDSSGPIPSAGEFLSEVTGRGFSPADAHRFLGLFYQQRRANRFLDTDLVGRSRSMRQLREKIWNLLFTSEFHIYERYLWNRMHDFPVLLAGPPGSGRSTVARTIGRSGWIPFDAESQTFTTRFTDTFRSIDPTTLSAEEIERELGHRSGPYETVYIGEIDALPDTTRRHLLDLLPDRFGGRPIASIASPTEEARASGILDDEIYYRLGSNILAVPTLAERISEDPYELGELVAHLVEKIVGEEAVEIVDRVRETIDGDLGSNHPWEGNLLELEQRVRRVLVSGTSI